MSYSVEVHRRYQNNKIITGRFVEQKNWRVLERGWRKRIVRCTDRLHKIHLFEWNAIWWVRMVREVSQGNKQPLVPTMYGQICGSMSDAAKKKAKQRWAIEKPKLDNARQLRRIFFIEPNDEEFKLTMKAARRKLEVPMPAAMPCKIPIKNSGATHRNIGKRKTKYACVVDADESTRPRLEGAGNKPHQCHITAKGMNSVTHHSLVHKFILMPSCI